MKLKDAELDCIVHKTGRTAITLTVETANLTPSILGAFAMSVGKRADCELSVDLPIFEDLNQERTKP